jgi:hypothetical protein
MKRFHVPLKFNLSVHFVLAVIRIMLNTHIGPVLFLYRTFQAVVLYMLEIVMYI